MVLYNNRMSFKPTRLIKSTWEEVGHKYVDKWNKVGLSQEPVDKDMVYRGIELIYSRIGLKMPWIEICNNPAEGIDLDYKVRRWQDSGPSIKQAIMTFRGDKEIRDGMGIGIQRMLTPTTPTTVDRVGALVRSDIRTRIDSESASDVSCYGSHSAPWLAIYDFLHEEGFADCSSLEGMFLIAKSCGWWIPRKGYCIVQHRHSEVHLDPQGRPHHPSKYAVAYPGEYGICAWHGMKVPYEFIYEKDRLRAKDILNIPNVELRRAACEIVGWDKILSELRVGVIDHDEDPQIGDLLEAHIPLDDRWSRGQTSPARFLRVRCGTGRTFVIPVPRQCKTAREANAWTYGLTPSQLTVEVRT